jgi:hypothetical protein
VGSNAVASVKSIFTGQTQVQRWPGAEQFKGTLSLPPLTQQEADEWLAALLSCQGMTNAFLLGDPTKITPRGTVTGTPIVDTSHAMTVGSSTLYTYGWTPNSSNVLIAGDYIQVGYRLYRATETASADADGKAALSIWPSLREAPTGLIVTNNPQGLFRLATNDVGWSTDYTRLSTLTISVQEYR